MEENLPKKLVLVGNRGCGTSSLIHRITKDIFLGDLVDAPFVYDGKCCIDVDDKKMALNLVEAKCRNEYDRLRPLNYQNSDLILMCFSIGSQESFGYLAENLLPEVRRYIPDVPIIVVANKKDLRVSSDADRLVTSEQGRALAEEIGAYAYLECSAQTKEGLQQVFVAAATASLQNHGKTKKNRGCWHCSIL